MTGLNELIVDHPAAVLMFMGGLVALSKFMLWLMWLWGKRELVRFEATEKDQDAKLEALRQDSSTLTSIGEKLEDHVSKEEKVWEEIRDIGRQVRDMRRQLPNGDLKAAIIKLDTLTSAFDRLATEVRAHNTEAEVWKRKIEVQDVRLKVLEKK